MTRRSCSPAGSTRGSWRRPLLHRHLDPQALAAVLPGPDVRTAFKNPVNAGGAVRLLLGFALLLDAWEQPGA